MNTARILRISGTEIDEALQGTTRQYLVGDLSKPEQLRHIPSSLIEIGITRYGAEGGTEATHSHKRAFEFQYVTCGVTAYLNTITGEQYVFKKGDFYLIEHGVVYAQKSGPHTEILFIKVPPGNDKVALDITPDVQTWFGQPIER
jgi:8-oxo-dGTP diphosphatase